MHGETENGTLERLPVAELLQHVADTEKSAEVVVQSSSGPARLWFRIGHLMDAQMGELNGEAAVTELLDVKEGTYTIEYKAVHGLPAINESVAALIGRRKRRAAEWQRLVAELGGLEAELTVKIRGLAAARKALTKADFDLLELIDSRRAIVDVVDLSGLDPVAVLERLVWYCQAGLVRLKGSPSAPPPAPDTIEPVAFQSSEGSLARPPPKPRTGTLVGVVTPEQPAETGKPAGPARASIVPAPIIPLKTTAQGALVQSRTSSTLVGFAAPPTESAPPPASPSTAPPPVASTPASPDWPSPEPPPAPLRRDERPSEAPVLPVRALLGRYEVLCRIARGGMGSVYLCRVTGEGGFRRLFALKALRERLTRDAAATRMFLQEARIAAKIYDPHVVGIVDVGMHLSQPYLVMDYVEGGSLQQLLRRHPRYRPPRLIVPLLLDALAGLYAAHTLTDDDGAPLELVHCDVSPHNMLVGVDGTCRLSDFGIAKAAAAAGSRGVTGSHGKPGYLSPEQAAGRRVDRRADLFSLGVVMWNALTGERLFSGRSVDEALADVLYKEIPRPSTVGLKPPACLDAICMKALARDPAARYQTAEEMLRALRTVALREDLLASSSDVARWVSGTFGEELQDRRLAVLDASRRVKAAGASESEVPEAERSSHTDGLRRYRRPSSVPPDGPASGEPRDSDLRGRESADTLDEPLPSGPANSAPASSARSQTIVLPRKQERKNRVVLAAAALSVLVVIFALAWPNQLAKLFRLEMAAPRATPSTFEPNLPSLQPPQQAPHETAPVAPGAAKAADNARLQVP